MLPKPFEPDFYRATYPELAALSDAEAERHFREKGIGDGLLSSPGAVRHSFIPLVPVESAVLEIGPFNAPAITGDNVAYLDAYDREGLIQRADEMGLDTTRIPAIDYVSPTGTFEMVGRTFSAAFGSHSIEHQPDFIQHLRNVSSVLEAEGRYYIICPDKRFCFDHFRPETTIADIVIPYLLEARLHQPHSFAEQLLLTTHNDPQRHWSGDHGIPAYKDSRSLRVPEIRAHIQLTSYADCHAWQFTPQGFFEITLTLAEVGLTDLYPERVYHTPAGLFEFTAVLRKTRCFDGMLQAFISASPAGNGGHSTELQNVIKGQQAQLTSAVGQINALTAKVALLQEELREVYASRSWRVTGPLRSVSSMIRS